jgi:hypothetical protein
MERSNKKTKAKNAGHSIDYYFQSSLQKEEQQDYAEDYTNNYDYEYDSRYTYKKGNVKAGKPKNKYNQTGDAYDYPNDQHYVTQKSPYKYDNTSHHGQYSNGYEKKTRPNQDISNVLRRKDNLNRVIRGVEVPELTMNLMNGLLEGNIECLICNEVLRDQDETWGCEKCFTMFHNTCIYDWIFKLNSQSTNTQIFKWTCPHCSNVTQTAVDKLPTYNCYCGRFFTAQKDKHFNPDLIPHGCGIRCNFNVCRHLTCKIPCHPGPHMVCSVVENITCYCTKSNKDVVCSTGVRDYSCNSVCGKFLQCGKHKCKAICHASECVSFLKNGKCQECVVESKNKFLTFLKQLETKIENELKEHVSIADSLADYIFHGILLCGQHTEEVNTDNSLKLLLKLLQVSGPKLVENIKTFIPVCKQEVDNNCNCGTKKSKNLCYRINYGVDILKFLGIDGQKVNKNSYCTKVCKTLKSCKIHKCNLICCGLMGKQISNYSVDDPNGDHLCLLPCEKVLACGKHKCEDYCHKSSCRPCANLIKEGFKSCTCGKTKLDPPYQCGVEPICLQPCSRRLGCEHRCKLNCHSFECPPCDEITFKVCKCKKNIINNIKCGSETPSCTTACGEMLPCGAHFCNLICHEHNEEFDINYFCMMPCGREMPCKHKCTKRCHGESECREVECEAVTKVYCPCKTIFRSIKCGELLKLNQKEEQPYVYPCNEECKKALRMKKIEECFQGLLKFDEERFGDHYRNKTPAEVTSEDKVNIKYIDIKYDHGILRFAKHKLSFIIEVENIVEKALKNITSSKYEIPKLDKNTFITTAEYLKTYYNIVTEKGKKQENMMNLVLSDCSEAHLPGFRLSLFGLLFKSHRFVKNTKIHHPFEMSIHIHNYRYQITEADIDDYIGLYCSKNDFYVSEVEKTVCYVHFFKKEIGLKVYEQVKSKPSQFQDCYDIQYDKKDELRYKDLYQYLRDEENLEFAIANEEEEVKIAKEIVVPVQDKDGFIKVGKKGKF